VESGLLLNVVVGQGAAVLELLASEDQALLVGRNALLVLDLALNVVDGIGGLNLEGDGLAGEVLTKICMLAGSEVRVDVCVDVDDGRYEKVR